MKRLVTLIGVVALLPLLSACAAPIVAGITLGTLSTIASAVSVSITGKDLGDHALSTIENKDCNITEGVLRSDRDICEPENSLATVEDFHGVFAFFGGERTDPLTRFARARQQEMLLAAAPAPTYALARQEKAHDGIGLRGSEPGLVRLNGKLVYAMAPVYSAGDAGMPAVAIPRAKGPGIVPKAKPKLKDRNLYQAQRTAELLRWR
jgi:hypothetical protein